MSLFNVFTIAGSALNAQTTRLNMISSNLANAESMAAAGEQPYRAKQTVLVAAPVGSDGAQGVQVAQIRESSAPFRSVYDPKNPNADDTGFVPLPNVDAMEEMVNMLAASRSYQTNAEVMNTAKTLLLKTLAIGQ